MAGLNQPATPGAPAEMKAVGGNMVRSRISPIRNEAHRGWVVEIGKQLLIERAGG